MRPGPTIQQALWCLLAHLIDNIFPNGSIRFFTCEFASVSLKLLILFASKSQSTGHGTYSQYIYKFLNSSRSPAEC